MSLDINGYYLEDGLTTANAGMCQWGFAKKDGHEYFIKEFLSPKYPLDESKLGPELTQKMRDSADAFFEKKTRFYDKLAKCRTGNNMVILDFFRHGAKYYAVTDRVKGELLTVGDVAKFTDDQKYTLVRSILYSVSALHSEGIVHSDLKPENILIKKTANGYCTAKIIDFDAGFLETAVPDRIEGSQNYYSPEAIKKISDVSTVVTTKTDVWALGLLIHQYWCGKMPSFSEKYHYAAEAVLNGSMLSIDDVVPRDIKMLIGKMLSGNPDERPSANEAWKQISKASNAEEKVRHTSTDTSKSEEKKSSGGWHVPDDLD